MMTLPAEWQSAARGGAAKAQALLVRVLRRTPLRSGHTVILTYTAPKSCRVVTLPVWAARDGDDWLVGVAASEAKTWWKAFRRPLPAKMEMSDGSSVVLVGQLVTDPDALRSGMATYFAQMPSSAERFQRENGPLIRFTPA